MKKLFISLCTVAALSACSEAEVTFEQPQEIGLNAVVQNRTRVMVNGTDFPSENFRVWAWYKQISAGTTIDAWQAATETQQLYINEKEFQHNGEDLWQGVTSFFWPKLGSLLFAGYYPTSVADKVSYAFDANTNQMTIEDYSPTSDAYVAKGFVNKTVDANHEEDLMYFNMTPNSANGNNVNVTFKHALSWLTVTVAKSADTPEDATITVSSIQFTDVKTTGTGTVNGDADIAWVPADTKANISIVGANEGILTTTAATLAKEPVIIPQAMAGNLVVTYTITSTDGSNFTETKTIALADLKEGTEADQWEAGKHYTYAITIGTSEILINPSVEGWDNITIPTVEI